MNKLTKKGFTLIEVMITLAVLAILIAVVSPFFFSNYKALNESDIRMDIQNEGDKSIEDLTNEALKANSIKSIKGNKGKKIDLGTNKEVDISSIEFNNADGKSSECQFKLKDAYNKESLLKYIKISPLPSAVTLDKAKGIEVHIGLQKKSIEKELKTKIYFRNSD